MTAGRPATRLVVALLVTGVQLASAYVVLGVPDLDAAREFLTGTLPTMPGSVAAAELVLWLALLTSFAGIVGTAVLGTLTTLEAARRSTTWSVVMVVIGIVILAAGVHHRSTAATVTVSGGSLQEARAELAR